MHMFQIRLAWPKSGMLSVYGNRMCGTVRTIVPGKSHSLFYTNPVTYQLPLSSSPQGEIEPWGEIGGGGGGGLGGASPETGREFEEPLPVYLRAIANLKPQSSHT